MLDYAIAACGLFCKISKFFIVKFNDNNLNHANLVSKLLKSGLLTCQHFLVNQTPWQTSPCKLSHISCLGFNFDFIMNRVHKTKASLDPFFPSFLLFPHFS